MGAPYTSVTVSNYNANPPPDDGSAVVANQLTWAKHKTKIGDPLKTAIESINTGIGTAFGKVIGGSGITTTALSVAIGSSDQGKLVVATAAGITLTTPDATVVTSPFVCGVLNNSSGDVSLDGHSSQTINGSAALTMKPGDGWLLFTDGTNWFVIGRKTGILPRAYIDGCTLSNGTDATNDINIAAGVCRDSTNTVDITVAAMSGKQLDANWAAGAAAGMRNSAAGITNSTYHIYAVAKADGTQDIYAYEGVDATDPDASATISAMLTALQAESGGAAYVYARRLGSILRSGGAILGFVQRGNQFDLKTSVLDYNQANPGLSALTIQLGSVPEGLVCYPIFSANIVHSGAGEAHAFFNSLDLDNEILSPGVGAGNGMVVNAAAFTGQTTISHVRTNTSRQIRGGISGASETNITLQVRTRGWIDTRGRL